LNLAATYCMCASEAFGGPSPCSWSLIASQVADALNGAEEAQNCSVAPKVTASAQAPRVPAFPLPKSGYVVFADPSPLRGSDSVGDGSPTRPFLTLERAVAAVRAKRAPVGAAALPSTIVLRAGTFHLKQTLQLAPEDSFLTFQVWTRRALGYGKQLVCVPYTLWRLSPYPTSLPAPPPAACLPAPRPTRTRRCSSPVASLSLASRGPLLRPLHGHSGSSALAASQPDLTPSRAAPTPSHRHRSGPDRGRGRGGASGRASVSCPYYCIVHLCTTPPHRTTPAGRPRASPSRRVCPSPSTRQEAPTPPVPSTSSSSA
jgi:hypothetical protein